MAVFDELGRLVVQTSLAGGIGGLIVYLLTLPQRRRKISAGATVDEATAASTLSGEALRWVEEARAEARAARLEADLARKDGRDSERRHHDELEMAHARIDALERRERDLEDVIRDLGGHVPPHRRAYDHRPTSPRTVDDVESTRPPRPEDNSP